MANPITLTYDEFIQAYAQAAGWPTTDAAAAHRARVDDYWRSLGGQPIQRDADGNAVAPRPITVDRTQLPASINNVPLRLRSETPPPTPPTPAPGGGVAPQATPTAVSPPLSFEQMMERAGSSDVIRRLALNSPVAPAFRGILEGELNRQLSTFPLQAAMGGVPGLPFSEFEEDPLGSFRRFAEAGGRSPGIRETLGQALGFAGGAASPAQQSVQQNLMNKGYIGSELFAPVLNLLDQLQRGRSIAGFDVGGATTGFLKDTFAREPERFGSLQQLGDFLRQQRII